jgi:hypothetical protein
VWRDQQRLASIMARHAAGSTSLRVSNPTSINDRAERLRQQGKGFFHAGFHDRQTGFGYELLVRV